MSHFKVRVDVWHAHHNEEEKRTVLWYLVEAPDHDAAQDIAKSQAEHDAPFGPRLVSINWRETAPAKLPYLLEKIDPPKPNRKARRKGTP